MSIVTKRREEDEEIPRPGATPSRMTAQPSQPHMTAAASLVSRTTPVVAHGARASATFTIKGEIHSEEDLWLRGRWKVGWTWPKSAGGRSQRNVRADIGRGG